MTLKLPATRRSIGLSQMRLAASAGISRWRLIQAELGNLDLTESELKRVSHALREFSREKIDSLTRFVNNG
jgi:predicted transcriptional regulator